MKRLYLRCNGGDLFRLVNPPEGCPFDGWFAGEFVELAGVAEELGEHVSIDALRQRGIGDDVLARVLVIDFGSEASMFEGISPGHVVADGKLLGYAEMPLRLL